MSNSITSQSLDHQSDVRDYITLLKPRVMSLVVFTAIAGIVLAPGSMHPILAFTTILAISMGAGASGAINMWFDRDIDAVMSRTSNRPLPKGRLDPSAALAFGIFLSVVSISLLALAVNYWAAFWLAFTIFFYVFIYTMWLKRSTSQNIVIGGAAGAFPPMISWVAVTGELTIEPIILFLIIFLWTPPHFWALALYKNGDYQKANIPMLPAVKGAMNTKIQMLFYTLLLFPVTLAPWLLGMNSMVYAIIALVLNLVFLYYAIRVFKHDHYAPKMFGYSILYLFMLFLAMMIDHIGVIGG
jgi:heme o synthase